MNFMVSELKKQILSGRNVKCFDIQRFPDVHTGKPIYSLTVVFNDGERSDVWTQRLEMKTYVKLDSVFADIKAISGSPTFPCFSVSYSEVN